MQQLQLSGNNYSREFVWRWGADKIKNLYPQSAFSLAQILYCFAEKIDKLELIKSPNFIVNLDILDLYCNYINRLLANEPLSKIMGIGEFYGFDFKINHQILDPRYDTHILIDAVLKNTINTNKYKILDIGCGSGCISIILANYFQNSDVTGIDYSVDAVNIAGENASILCKSDNCNFEICDIFNDKLPIGFDIIISNPPYIPTKAIEYLDDMVKLYDPITALDGGDDGLIFYQKIAENIVDMAVNDAQIFLEFGIGQGAYIKEILSHYGCSDFVFYRDDGYIIRALYCKLKKSS